MTCAPSPTGHLHLGNLRTVVVRRGDGIAADNLAVVINDAAQGVAGQMWRTRTKPNSQLEVDP
jgi:glutamyl/glutaminyl-tRNA synthetase